MEGAESRLWRRPNRIAYSVYFLCDHSLIPVRDRYTGHELAVDVVVKSIHPLIFVHGVLPSTDPDQLFVSDTYRGQQHKVMSWQSGETTTLVVKHHYKIL